MDDNEIQLARKMIEKRQRHTESQKRARGTETKVGCTTWEFHQTAEPFDSQLCWKIFKMNDEHILTLVSEDANIKKNLPFSDNAH